MVWSGWFGVFDPPVPLTPRAPVPFLVEDPEAAAALSDKPCTQLLERFEALLLEKAELLKEYFMLEIQVTERHAG